MKHLPKISHQRYSTSEYIHLSKTWILFWLCLSIDRSLLTGWRGQSKQSVINKQSSKPSKSVSVCVCVFMYLFDGSLSNFVWVLPDALQEVSQLCHGRVPDLCPQLGDVFCHDWAKPVLTHPGKTCLFELLQGSQSRVVPTVTHRKIHRTSFIHSVSQLISYELNSNFRLGSNLCKSSVNLQSFAYGQETLAKLTDTWK